MIKCCKDNKRPRILPKLCWQCLAIANSKFKDWTIDEMKNLIETYRHKLDLKNKSLITRYEHVVVCEVIDDIFINRRFFKDLQN